MRRLLVGSFLLAMAFSALVHAAEKTSIEVACYPPFDEGFRQILPNFYKAYPNIEVNLKIAGYGDHHNALVTSVVAGEGVPDAAVVEIGYIAQFMAEGGLADLNQPPFQARRFKRKTTTYKWAQATDTHHGQLIAFPLDVAPGCAYWRRDHFAEVGVDIEQIKTMDDLFAIAGKLTRDTDGDGKIDQWFTSNAENIFWMILRSHPKRFHQWDGIKQTWDSQQIIDALIWAKKFRNAGYTANIEAWSNGWYNAFRNGTIAYEISGAWLGGHLKSWIAPNTSGKWGVARWPALTRNSKPMAGNWGGSFMSIPHASKNKNESWRFIRYVCTDKKAQLALYRTSDSFPAYTPVWKDPIFEEKLDFFSGQQARLLWIDVAKDIPEKSTSKYDNVIYAVIDSELHDFLQKETSAEKAFENIRSQIGIRSRRIKIKTFY